jgi:hypothetical protein
MAIARSGNTHEIKVGDEYYLITFDKCADRVDQACPRCRKKKAFSLTLDIEEIQKGDGREPVELTEEVRREFDGHIRQWLLEQGWLVTLELDCLGCNLPKGF